MAHTQTKPLPAFRVTMPTEDPVHGELRVDFVWEPEDSHMVLQSDAITCWVRLRTDDGYGFIISEYGDDLRLVAMKVGEAMTIFYGNILSLFCKISKERSERE